MMCSTLSFHLSTFSRWIRVVTMRNVQELVLNFSPYEQFELPRCGSACESLQVLKLRLNWKVLKLPSHLGFRQLKLLHLVRVELSNEQLTNCLFSRCPILETLTMEDCTFGNMAVIDIASVSLVNLCIIYCYDDESYLSNCIVKISCPNLKVWKYNAPLPKDIVIDNLLSIEFVDILFFDPFDLIVENDVLGRKIIKNIPSISVLSLCISSIWGLCTLGHEPQRLPVTFNKLRCLKLAVTFDKFCIQRMILLLRHSPNLEELNLWVGENDDLDENWKLLDPSESIVCLESHLKLIKLNDFKYDKNEMELLRFFLNNAHVLEKLMVFWASDAERSKEALEVDLKCPGISPHVVVTFHDIDPTPKQHSRIKYDAF